MKIDTVAPVYSNGAATNDYHLMLFDLSIRGHHPAYIQHLIRYWSQQGLPGRLSLVVSPRFLQEHADVVALAYEYGQERVQFVAIQPDEEAALSSRKSSWTRFRRAFQEWELLCRYASSLQVSNCLVMYLDSYQLPIAVGFKCPCPISGIYFRPTFHYGEFVARSSGWSNSVQRWRERVVLNRMLHHPQFRTLFCLDPFAVDQLTKLYSANKAIYLPDPIEFQEVELAQLESLKRQLGITGDRSIFLLFGALTERKGIFQLLDAIARLPTELCEKLCVVFVGESRLKAELEVRATLLSENKPVQLIRQYEFVSNADVSAYFQMADAVLAPYQQHIGMSGVLLWAAAAQKPVLSSNYGLMGELVQRYRLGITIDSTIPSEITAGLIYLLTNSLDKIGDRISMQQFAEQNAAENYATTIFNYLSNF